LCPAINHTYNPTISISISIAISVSISISISISTSMENHPSIVVIGGTIPAR
jgi:hypothetical protein